MKVIILGSGRVGSAIAQSLSAAGSHVSVIDNDPDSLMRLGGDAFTGDFFVGEAMDPDVLERAGISHADAFIASTDDDNINVVMAQIAQRRYHVENVVVRVFDPDKAAFYERRGMRVVCPTNRAIDEMIAAVEPARAGVGAVETDQA
ncbi:MAG: TrkA family potassium uptake protein [Thermoleophilia bacterium]|nr:TrkA family potassium uptake protein [Thermoleophilia bacterium]